MPAYENKYPDVASAAAIDTAIPRAWDGFLAYVISQVGSPPVLAVVAMALLASTLSSPRAWRWAGVYVFLAIVTPILYLFWLLSHGWVSDLDVQLREVEDQRPLGGRCWCRDADLVADRGHPAAPGRRGHHRLVARAAAPPHRCPDHRRCGARLCHLLGRGFGEVLRA